MCTYYLVPLILAIGVVLALVLGSGFIEQWNGITVLADVNSSALDTGQQEIIKDAATGFLETFALIFIVSLLVFGAFSFISFFAYAAVLASALKPGLSYRNALAAGKKQYWRLIGFFFLFSLVFSGALLVIFILLVIVGIFSSIFGGGFVTVFFFHATLAFSGIAVLFLASRWSLAPYCIAAQNAGAFSAFGASWRLTSRRSWAMIGYSVFVLLLFAAVYLVMALLDMLISSVFSFGMPVQNSLTSYFSPAENEIPFITPAFIVFRAVFLLVSQTVFALFMFPWTASFFRQVYAACVQEKRHL
jgi:hypothetical protein